MLTKQKMREEFGRRVQHLTLMDNVFMNLCLNNNIPCVQAIVRIILGRKDLRVIKTQTQKNFQGFERSLTIDVYAEDDEGTIYNIEIQKTNEGASPRRARFHGSMLDVHNLNKGQKFTELPECYIIFITLNDVLGFGDAVYRIERYIEGKNERFDDGLHIIYVNCSAQTSDKEISALLHDMLCEVPEKILIPELAERVSHFKKKQKGDNDMDVSNAVHEEENRALEEFLEQLHEDWRKEDVLETEKNIASKLLLLGKNTPEEISLCSGLPLSEVKALANQL